MMSRLLVAGSFLWLAAIVVAPFGFDLPYVFGSFICHQHPGRSFWIAGSPMPVCARCTGLYASASAGAAFALVHAGLRPSHLQGLQRPLRASTVRAVLLLAAVPTMASVIVEWCGVAEPSSVARFLAALPLGAAAGWVVVRSAQARS